MKTITVVIDEQGEASIDLAGYHGQGCSKTLADFLDGARPTVEHTKREYTEKDKAAEREKAKA